MDIQDLQIDTTSSVDLEWREVVFMPIGDLQLGAGECDERRFKEDIEEAKERQALVLFMGDLLDVARPTMRKRLREAGLDEDLENVIQDWADKLLRRLLDMVAGINCVGVLQGHHFMVHRDGRTTDQIVAQELGAPFLGTSTLTRLSFHRAGRTARSITIFAHHGAGSGQKASSPLNKLENIMAGWDADIYVMGHQSKPAHASIPQLRLSHGKPLKIVRRDRYLVATGSYLSAYSEGESSYVEQALMRPASLGCPRIRLKPRHRHRGSDHVSVGVESWGYSG